MTTNWKCQVIETPSNVHGLEMPNYLSVQCTALVTDSIFVLAIFRDVRCPMSGMVELRCDYGDYGQPTEMLRLCNGSATVSTEREALDRLCVRLNMYLVEICNIKKPK